jgi:hypothetical protein
LKAGESVGQHAARVCPVGAAVKCRAQIGGAVG